MGRNQLWISLGMHIGGNPSSRFGHQCMARFLCSVALIALTLGLLSGCADEKHASIAPGTAVLVLGDSLTYGTGGPPGYVPRLQELTGWSLIAAGVPGDTTARGLARLPDLLREHQPQVVIIALGGNDFLRRVPPAETRANLITMIGMVKDQGMRPVLIGMPQPSLIAAVASNLSDANLYAELAEQQDVPLLSGTVSEILSEESLRADQIHPNTQGYEQLAGLLAGEARRIGLLR